MLGPFKKLISFVGRNWAEILGLILVAGISNTYGPLLFARATGNVERYNIGAECDAGRWGCAEKYFRTHVDEINKLVDGTETEIGERIIRESRASYSGSCPCPYNSDSRGYSCGGRSAYSRYGGADPYCYVSDLSSELIQAKREDYIYEAEDRLDRQIEEYTDVYANKAPLVLSSVAYLFYLSRRKKHHSLEVE